MLNLSLQEMAFYAQGKLLGANSYVTKVVLDTRQVTPGALFVAICGQKIDSHNLALQALQNGATAILTERILPVPCSQILVANTKEALVTLALNYRLRFQPLMLALTGSAGKTTTKEMLASIAKCYLPTLATSGNLNSEYGVALTLLELKLEQRLAIIEMGARYVGDIDKLMLMAKPRCGLITNIGTAHIEIFGSRDNIAYGKAAVYRHLPKDGIAIINKDDEYYDFFIAQNNANNIITFGLQDADITPQSFQLAPLASTIQILDMEITLKVPGLVNIKNALAAIASAKALNIPHNFIKLGLENFKATSGRLEFKRGYQQANIIDDTYNASLQAVQAALEILARLEGKKIFVFADMAELGDEAIASHQQIGNLAKKLQIDLLFTLGSLTALSAEIFASKYHFTDKKSLVNELKKHLDANTYVLVKGSRSMQMEEIVGELLQC